MSEPVDKLPPIPPPPDAPGRRSSSLPTRSVPAHAPQTARTPPTRPPTVERLRLAGESTVRFLRRYAEGVETRDLQRLFEQDATRAFTTLVAAERRGAPPEKGLTRLLSDVKSVFLGLSFKLSPPRRLLFAGSILLVLAGVFDGFWSFATSVGPTRIFLDFSPLLFLGGMAGMTILLALEMVDRVRVRDELEVARQLQRELLPQGLRAPAGYHIAHSARTANEIGGDYYDLLPLDDGRVVITVGDASGHGIAAGLVMAIATATFKTAIDLDPDPAAVLALVNRVLCRTGGKRAFMSLFYGVLEPASGRLCYACAGHPYPMLRRGGGRVEELGKGALPLGIQAETHWEAVETTVDPGDLLVLYSDGLPEAIGGEDEQAFGFERLHGLLTGGGSAHDVHDRILASSRRFLGERSLDDDLTLVVLAREPTRAG